MIDNVIWRVEQIDIDHESSYGHPSVTAILKMLHDPFKPYPEWYFSEQLMDDLNERLDTQPKVYQVPLENYCLCDVRLTNAAVERMVSGNHFMIKKVIFNNPATIIMWRDGSKTVVKCQPGDVYDPEKGFVMAYLKKLLGNDNTFNKEIAKWVKYDEPKKDKHDAEKINWFGSKPQEITFTIKADQITFDELE